MVLKRASVTIDTHPPPYFWGAPAAFLVFTLLAPAQTAKGHQALGSPVLWQKCDHGVEGMDFLG